MSIAIYTDSAADIPVEIATKYNIRQLPLTIHFGKEEFRDGIDLTSEMFYEKLENCDKLPTTSQINPAVFAKCYEKELEKGNSVISIHISSELSGTYNSATIAKRMVNDDKISVIDSRSATLALGFVVIRAAQLAEKGLKHDEIVKEIEDYKNNIKIFVAVDTLEYLKKGGRLSGAQAVIGSMFNVKPILTINDGKVSVIDKVRGSKRVVNRIMELVEEYGGNLSNRVIGIVNAKCPEIAEVFKKMIEDKYSGVEFIESEVGSTIATHAGPGAYGIIIG